MFNKEILENERDFVFFEENNFHCFKILEKLKRELSENLSTDDFLDFSVLGETLFIKDFKISDTKKIRQRLISEIIKNGAKKVSFSFYLGKEKKRLIYDLISENNPYMNIIRLFPNTNVVNVKIGGIKQLNDNLSKDFTDIFINKFKKRLLKKLDDLSQEEFSNTRVIRNDYKNLTFSLDVEEKIEFIFSNFTEKKDILEHILDGMQKEIKLFSQKIGTNKEQIEDTLRYFFDFGVGMSKTSNEIDSHSQIKSFYEAEIISQKNMDKKKVDVATYDRNYIKEMAQNALNLEKEIIEARENEKFEFNEVEYDVILEEFGKKILNPMLLKLSRKYCEFENHIGPQKLKRQICDYISYLNKGFDFLYSYDHFQESITYLEQLDKDIQRYSVSSEAILKNHKGAFVKEAFEKYVKDKKGHYVFLDIRDMGVQNFLSFKQLAQKILYDDFEDTDLLKGGDEITSRFFEVFNMIKKFFPESIVSMGGDEIYMFLEGLEEEKIGDFLQEIEKIIGKNGFQARLSYFDKQEGENVKFDNLEQDAKIIKKIEEKIEGIFQKFEFEKELFLPKLITIKNFSQNIIENVEEFLDEEKLFYVFKSFLNNSDFQYQVNKKASKYKIFFQKESEFLNVYISN